MGHSVRARSRSHGTAGTLVVVRRASSVVIVARWSQEPRTTALYGVETSRPSSRKLASDADVVKCMSSRPDVGATLPVTAARLGRSPALQELGPRWSMYCWSPNRRHHQQVVGPEAERLRLHPLQAVEKQA